MTDEVLAWAIDEAVAIRLLHWDAEMMKQQARRTAYEVSKIFGDGSRHDDEEGETVSGQYANADTQYW